MSPVQKYRMRGALQMTSTFRPAPTDYVYKGRCDRLYMRTTTGERENEL
jgi:hypothetical protein